MRAEHPVRWTFVTAGMGLGLGAVAVPILASSYAPLAVFVFAGLVALASRRRDSRAAGGGFIVAFALWWFWFIWRAVEQCAEWNAKGGRCEIYGTTEYLILAACVGGVGVALVLIALRDGPIPT